MPIPVTTDHPITCGVFEGFSWIRCEGKGSFLNSPLVKSFGDARVGEGESVLVIDLAACSGMDSTFMGTLAGMAARLAAVDGGILQVAGADERNRRSLEDLGLDFMMQIDPKEPSWKDDIENIRSQLKPAQAVEPMNLSERARHVLRAHEELTDLNEKNAREFENVVGTLKRQVDKESPPES
ncbi:MAG: STAS domain-containing protein [Akkermansiaceae bacterium]|nr:STAS domain-containing protein [Akkermansiaceae bacterium]